MEIKKDYRNTEQCLALIDISAKKSALENKIREDHKKTKIIYNKVKNKNDTYYKEFAEIYNYKCAYCGSSMKFTDSRLFEVDHFICESAFSNDTAGRAQAGKLKNLTFSCYSCNRGKGSLHIKDGYIDKLNPDDKLIADLFYRDKDYYIKISNYYNNDRFIELFYDKLMLGSEFRRLDFLLLEMDNLVKKMRISNKELAQKLEQCINRLIQKKNFVFR